MNAPRFNRPAANAMLFAFVLWLAAQISVAAAAATTARPPMVTTNYVRVTNAVIVLVTNYVVTTNLVLVTNGLAAKPQATSSAATLPDLGWVPPPDSFDWVQLKSGEWLKGRIRAMQDRQLDFSSEEMDDQTFDWKDIRQLRSSRSIDVLFINEQRVSGPVVVTPTAITVGHEGAQTVSRDQLQSLTQGGSHERDYWSGNVSVGLTLRGGNSEQVDYNATGSLQRRTPSTRVKLDYTGNYSLSEDVESANNHRINAEFDYWLSRRLYLILPGGELYSDPFQNIRHRLTGGLGVGYDLIDRRNVEWSITAGPAYQYSIYESSQAGEPTEKGAGALTFGTRFDWDITRKIEYIFEYRGQYTRQEVGETTHHAVNTFSFDITKQLDLDISLTWDRIQNPQIGEDGVQPKSDDYRLVVGLGLDF